MQTAATMKKGQGKNVHRLCMAVVGMMKQFMPVIFPATMKAQC